MDGLPCGLVVKHVGSKVFSSMPEARAMIKPYYQDSMVTLFCGDSRRNYQIQFHIDEEIL